MFDIVCVAPLIFIDHLSLRMPLNGAVPSQGEYSMSFKEKSQGVLVPPTKYLVVTLVIPNEQRK